MEEFQIEHRCALLKILFDAYKRYVEDGNKLCVPKTIKDRTLEYMESSSDILGWINDNYTKTEDKTNFIRIKDVHEKFKNSSYFNNLTKQDKRNYSTEKEFVNRLQENYFLKDLYCARKK